MRNGFPPFIDVGSDERISRYYGGKIASVDDYRLACHETRSFRDRSTAAVLCLKVKRSLSIGSAINSRMLVRVPASNVPQLNTEMFSQRRPYEVSLLPLR